ncbi:MAG TPA: type IV toxin-antitoxin system AbiEi family antitoxin [Clostridiaceae bacterium]
MKGYIELAKLSVFSLPDVEKLTGNKKTAYSLLDRLTVRGLVKKIRNNIYSCINPATGQVIASRYQIACASSSSAYISHHTAFEYYGLANQVYYEVYVSSVTRFRDFEFENVSYKYVASKMDDGVIVPKNSDGIRVTDLERTVIDSVKNFEKIAGFEELINCLSAVHYLNEEKLIVYLDSYNIQALYQKTGFLLEYYMHEKQLSKAFIDYCKNKIGKSTRYLFKEVMNESAYNREWKLVVPAGLFNITEQGCEELV